MPVHQRRRAVVCAAAAGAEHARRRTGVATPTSPPVSPVASLTRSTSRGCIVSRTAASPRCLGCGAAQASLASTGSATWRSAASPTTRVTRTPPRHLPTRLAPMARVSSTPLTDTGVGKLVAIIEDGSPYGRVFKRLSTSASRALPKSPPPPSGRCAPSHSFARRSPARRARCAG